MQVQKSTDRLIWASKMLRPALMVICGYILNKIRKWGNCNNTGKIL